VNETNAAGASALESSAPAAHHLTEEAAVSLPDAMPHDLATAAFPQVRQRAEARTRIDRALAACEEANLTGPRRPPRWVLDLVAELQTATGSLVWEPADTAEAHAELLDLQVHHLDVPPAAALADALGQLAHARREASRLRKLLGPASDLEVLAEEVGREIAGLRSAIDQVRGEFRALLAAPPRERLPSAAGGLADAMAAAQRTSVHAWEADLEEIATAGGATLTLLRGPSRSRPLVELRRAAARYLRSRGCSLPEIGAALNRDHTSILHLLRTPVRSAGEAA
jgi:hypothetical protein